MGYLFEIGSRVIVNGRPIRPLFFAFCTDRYRDEIVCASDTPWGQLVGLFFRWLDKIRGPIIERDVRRHNVKDGELIPKWTLSHLHLQPYLLANKICSRVDGEAFHRARYAQVK